MLPPGCQGVEQEWDFGTRTKNGRISAGAITQESEERSLAYRRV